MNANTRLNAGPWLPLFMHLQDQRVLVVGGGIEAQRKINRLRKHGAQIDLVAASLNAELLAMHEQQSLSWLGAELPTQVNDIRLLVIAESDPDMKTRALVYGHHHRLLINAVDDPANCSAILPAIVDRYPITIAIGSGGAAPELARKLRSQLETQLPQWIGPLAQLSADLKLRIRERFPQSAKRRQLLHWLFTGAPARHMSQGQPALARTELEQALANPLVHTKGSVALVGAGPGDPELLTVKALRLIQEADVIVHDALVDERILDYARRDVEWHDVSKRGGRCAFPQVDIHQLLLRAARAGQRVVRLKGGDPMVFGRGGEELQFLRRHGIDYEVVPGITAAAGCAAYAGIPLTHRDHAQSLRLITAHGQQSVDKLDWRALAQDQQTLAFYMAVARIDQVQQQLLAHGRDKATPVALVENGTRPQQRVLVGSLEQLAALASQHQLQSPAMVYVGEVAALAAQLGWFGQPPQGSSQVESDLNEQLVAA
jgi:uroporphyrin-III C-methyltransferase/precorrin-2 dehydrogenase/sirohydrochlorin ferrochelatase